MPGANSAKPTMISHQYPLHPARTLPRSAIPRIRLTTDTGSGALPEAPYLHHAPTTLPPSPTVTRHQGPQVYFPPPLPTHTHHPQLTEDLPYNPHYIYHALEKAKALYLLHQNLSPDRELRGQPHPTIQDGPRLTLHSFAVLLEDMDAHQMIVTLSIISTLPNRRMSSSMSLDKNDLHFFLNEEPVPLITLKENNKQMLFVSAVVLSWTVEPALESPP